MNRPRRKYVLDTQLFIQGFREPNVNEALQQFHRSFAPFEYLHVIVAQELRSGARTRRDRQALERHVLNLFKRANRVVVPSVRTWHQSGDVLAEMARKDGDILLALSCREAGCVLVTDNARDFARIRRFAQFEFIGSWPMPLG